MRQALWMKQAAIDGENQAKLLADRARLRLCLVRHHLTSLVLACTGEQSNVC